MGVSSGDPRAKRGPTRLCVVLPHPAQYFSPLFDLIAADPHVDLQVIYGSQAGLRPTYDPGFGREVRWDVPLVEGHPHVFLGDGVQRGGRVSVRSIPSLISHVRSSDVVVIHGHATMLSWVAALVAKCLGVPYLTRSDTTVRPQRPVWDPRDVLARLFAKMSSGALASSNRNARVQSDLGSPRCYHVPLTVDVSRFSRQSAAVGRRDGRRQYGLPPDGPVVGYVGKFVEHKRVEDLLAAADFITPRPHIVLAGDGPLRDALKSQCADMADVTMLGFQNQGEMPPLLASLDVLVLPSSFEAWGLIVNEALSCAVVPVVSDHVGCASELVDGVGEVFPVGDVQALARAVTQALAADRAEFLENVASFKERFSLEQTAQQYVNAVHHAAVGTRSRG